MVEKELKRVIKNWLEDNDETVLKILKHNQILEAAIGHLIDDLTPYIGE